MRGREKILICLVVVIIISGSLGIWLSTRDKLPDAIRIASGPNGGEYYKFGEALEKKLSVRTKKTVKNRETDGTLENLRLLKEGVVEVALLQSIVFPDPNDEESNNITVIAPLFLEPLIVFADKKSGIESVYDLENRRVCTGPVKSGIAIASDTMLEFYGLKKVKRVNELFHENSIHKNRKNCDAGITVMGLRGPCLKEIGKTDVRVLELPYVQALAESEAFLSGFTLPEGVFARPPLTTLPHKNIQTIAYTALLAVRKDASPALVNEILDSIYNTNIQMNFPDLLPVKEVREWSKIPFNPTAREFYNPLRRMEVFATRMEAFAAVKELFFAFLAISYFVWLRFHELSKRRERILVQEIKEELDIFLQKTIILDQKQMDSESPEELQSIIAQITELKIQVLQELTNEKLRADQMFMIFLTQCHNIICKIQTKLLILQIND